MSPVRCRPPSHPSGRSLMPCPRTNLRLSPGGDVHANSARWSSPAIPPPAHKGHDDTVRLLTTAGAVGALAGRTVAEVVAAGWLLQLRSGRSSAAGDERRLPDVQPPSSKTVTRNCLRSRAGSNSNGPVCWRHARSCRWPDPSIRRGGRTSVQSRVGRRTLRTLPVCP